MFCYCRLQELKVQEQFWVHMNGILRNWKILPAPSEKNLPVLCIIAVRKDWGLKNPGSHTEAGKLKSEVQASNSLIRKIKSAYQFDSPFSDA